MLKVHDTVVVIVLHWTYGQSQNVVQSLLKYVPEVNILAVDNNPSISDIKDNPKRWESYMTWGLDWKRKDYRVSETWVRHFCDGESYWFHNHPKITCIKAPEFMPHGSSIDFALRWCVDNDIKKFIHIEPDCIIIGRTWYDRLIDAYVRGNWWAVVASIPGNNEKYFMDRKLPHPTPSICNVKKALEIGWRLQFVDRSNSGVFDIPGIESHVNTKVIKDHGYWDTSNLFFLQCSFHSKYHEVKCDDFLHIGWGRNKISPKAISFI
jgi:hypothetical protein